MRILDWQEYFISNLIIHNLSKPLGKTDLIDFTQELCVVAVTVAQNWEFCFIIEITTLNNDTSGIRTLGFLISKVFYSSVLSSDRGMYFMDINTCCVAWLRHGATLHIRSTYSHEIIHQWTNTNTSAQKTPPYLTHEPYIFSHQNCYKHICTPKGKGMPIQKPISAVGQSSCRGGLKWERVFVSKSL